MRVHDWSRVDDGTFHHFHHSWIEEIQRALNGGLLPAWLYALAEQHASEFGPDVLALQAPGEAGEIENGDGGTALLVAPPKAKMTVQGSQDFYTHKQKSVAVRHASDDEYHQPVDKPLTLVAYESKIFSGVTAYIEPIAVGDPLTDMPLYVSADGYVSIPLQETYDRAFAALPRRWASVLEQ